MNRQSFRRHLAFMVFLSASLSVYAQTHDTNNQNYTVAAYVWPSLHDEPRSREVLWPEGIGEWEIIQKGTPRFDGHYQPKVPLWGYQMDNDPQVMEKWIDVATDHGVNAFIFDWYWFDGEPFLESSLNDGFLKAPNNEKMKFYVMWANHNVKQNYWNVHQYQNDTTLLWEGAVDLPNFRKICDRVINQYFHQPNYFKIDGKPVFSVFSLRNLMAGLQGKEKTKEALDYFRDQTKQAGFPGLHVQLIALGKPSEEVVSDISFLGINSVTRYNWGGPHPEDYIQWGEEAIARRKQWSEALDIPYFPNASIGWDDTPRFPDKGIKDIVHYNKSPESFAAYLQKAKDYTDEHPNQPKIITIFSWNEWIEGGYLLPDMKYGFQYLDATRRVMDGTFDKY